MSASSTLAELPKKHEGEGRPYIYGRAGMRAFSGFSKAKRNLDAAILKWMQEAAARRGENPKKVEPIPHWTLHDIRRTGRSILSVEGVTNDIAERVLGHVMQGVRATYDRYGYLPEKRYVVSGRLRGSRAGRRESGSTYFGAGATAGASGTSVGCVSASEMLLNIPTSDAPANVSSTAMQLIATNTAIKQYSTDVAPLTRLRKFLIHWFPSHRHWGGRAR